MLLEVDKKYRIVYNPRCSMSCETTCISCKVDGIGEYTGRNWVDKDGEPLYEMWYESGGKIKYGIFKVDDIFKLDDINE